MGSRDSTEEDSEKAVSFLPEVSEHPTELTAIGTRMLFKQTSSYSYPSQCVQGEEVELLDRNTGTPPLQCRWVTSGHTYWIHAEDLVMAGQSAPRAAEKTGLFGRIFGRGVAPSEEQVVGEADDGGATDFRAKLAPHTHGTLRKIRA